MSWIHITEDKYVNTENGNLIVSVTNKSKKNSEQKNNPVAEQVADAKTEGRYIDLSGAKKPIITYMLFGDKVYASDLSAQKIMERVMCDKTIDNLRKKTDKALESEKDEQPADPN